MSVVAAAVGIGSAAVSYMGSKSAADTASDSADAQLGLSKEMFDRTDALQGELYDEQKGTINQGFRQNLGDINANQGQQIDLANILGMYGMQGVQQAHDQNASLFRQEMRRGTHRIQDATRGAIKGFRPALRFGNNALTAFAENLGVGNAPGYDYEMAPGNRYLLDEGSKAIEGSAAGAGGLYSGAAMEELQRHGMGIAAQDRAQQQAELFSLAGMGQGAAGSIANLKTGGAQSINALRGGYTDRLTEGNTSLARDLYGIGGDWAQGVGGALDGGLDRRIGARDFRTSSLGTARTNRANLQGNAAGQYMQGASGAYGLQGAAGVMQSNALANGINTGFGTYGYMGGQMPWMQQQATNPQAIPANIGTGGQGGLY
jgi:hypothetical protein